MLERDESYRVDKNKLLVNFETLPNPSNGDTEPRKTMRRTMHFTRFQRTGTYSNKKWREIGR